MDYFKTYCSNTLGGSGNQSYFSTFGKVETGRVYYRITAGGTFGYAVLFSNTMDSTYADGSYSHRNLICDSWELLEAKIGRCQEIRMEELPGGEAPEVTEWVPLLFAGEKFHKVSPGEFFASDRVELTFQSGEYLCLEMSFRGEMIPCHPETIMPVFRKEENGWYPSQNLPVASMVGCDRPVQARIGYLGDSITQGIGTAVNCYQHWNAVVSQMIGNAYAFWNLGIGYGRGNDAAEDGAWLFRAKQNDYVVVCFGVNDIIQYGSAEQTKKDLKKILDRLHAAGVKVLIQTVPPFDYGEKQEMQWREINRYILEELSQQAEAVFDVVPVLEDPEHPARAYYGGHPNAQGCDAWAKALYPILNALIMNS